MTPPKEMAERLEQAAQHIAAHRGHKELAEDLRRYASEIREGWGWIPLAPRVAVSLQRCLEAHGATVRGISGPSKTQDTIRYTCVVQASSPRRTSR